MWVWHNFVTSNLVFKMQGTPTVIHESDVPHTTAMMAVLWPLARMNIDGPRKPNQGRP